MIRGIDVSVWQRDIDFEKVKSDGIEFVIIRAGYGSSASQRDKYFEQNYSRAKAAAAAGRKASSLPKPWMSLRGKFSQENGVTARSTGKN